MLSEEWHQDRTDIYFIRQNRFYWRSQAKSLNKYDIPVSWIHIQSCCNMLSKMFSFWWKLIETCKETIKHETCLHTGRAQQAKENAFEKAQTPNLAHKTSCYYCETNPAKTPWLKTTVVITTQKSVVCWAQLISRWFIHVFIRPLAYLHAFESAGALVWSGLGWFTAAVPRQRTSIEALLWPHGDRRNAKDQVETCNTSWGEALNWRLVPSALFYWPDWLP